MMYNRARAGDKFKTGQCKVLSVHSIPESSYMNKGLFLQWLTYFVATVKPNVTAKILLLLDVHSTHTNSNEDPQLACDSGVVIILLPGNVTCRLQPPDVELLRPLSS